MSAGGRRELPAGVYLAGDVADRDAAAHHGLGALEDEVMTARLRRALAASAELVARTRDRHVADDDPAPVAAMQAACARPDAPLVLRSLLARVTSGRVTWEQVWRDPQRHDGGTALLAEVVRALPVRPR